MHRVATPAFYFAVSPIIQYMLALAVTTLLYSSMSSWISGTSWPLTTSSRNVTNHPAYTIWHNTLFGRSAVAAGPTRSGHFSACLHRLRPQPSCPLFATFCYSVAAASTAPAALIVLLLVTTTSTGYFHSINLAQPVGSVPTQISPLCQCLKAFRHRTPCHVMRHPPLSYPMPITLYHQASENERAKINSDKNLPQYAHLLPKYFPT